MKTITLDVLAGSERSVGNFADVRCLLARRTPIRAERLIVFYGNQVLF
jgi:hypothetical protein